MNTGRRRLGALALGIFLLALAPRFFYLTQHDAYPRFEKIKNKLDDQVVFHLWAEAVATGQDFDVAATGHEWAYWSAASPGVYPQSPLYPWWISLIYRLAGTDAFDVVRVGQMVLGALGCVGLFLLARRFTGELPAMVAAAALAFYGPLVFYEATYLRAGVMVSLLIAALLVTIRAAERPSRVRLVIAGLTLGLLSLLRPNVLLVAAALIGWLAWQLSRKASAESAVRTEEDPQAGSQLSRSVASLAARIRDSRFGHAPRRKVLAWTLLGLAMVLLPVSLINSWRSGGLAFLSSNGPINLFLGNVHDASGLTASTTPTYDAVKAKAPPEEIDLIAELARDIVVHPGAFLRLQVRKFFAFFEPREAANNLSFEMARQVNPALRGSAVAWHWVLPWALLGAVLGWRSSRRHAVVLALLVLAALVAATVPFFVLGRLRLPAVVPLLLLTAIAVDVLIEHARCGRRLPVALAILVALVTGALLGPAAPVHRYADYQMAAAAEVSAGDEQIRQDPAAAWRRYARAVALDPDHRSALERLAAYARPAAPLGPDAAALCDQAQSAAEAGELSKARRLLEDAVKAAPHHATPHHYLANVHMLDGDPRRAMVSLERAVERDPLSETLRQNLRSFRRNGGEL